MSKLVVVLPITVVFLIAYWYLKVYKLDALSRNKKAKNLPVQLEMYSLSKKDLAPMLIVTALYACVAFFMLGDTDAPQSLREYESGDVTVVDFGEIVEVSEIMYFTSLHTGTYNLEYSHNGEDYTTVCELTQNYNDLFKWKSAFLKSELHGQYFRITANDRLDLAELAFVSSAGELITPTYSENDSALFDEQNLFPEDGASYMNSTYFDEIYHPRTALENIKNVYPYEVSHPPLGKLILSIGIDNFGMTPFGWRFMGTLFGVLMLPVLYILVKLMFGSIAVAAATSFIFAFDFMHFVQTRIATIDTYAVFFILLSFLFMFLFIRGRTKRESMVSLALCGIIWGIGCASKWTVIYAGAGLGVIWFAHWFVRFMELKKARKLSQFSREFIANSAFCVVFFVIIPLTIYYVSYYPYGRAIGLSGVSMFFDPKYFETVIENQQFMFSYHSDLVATHPYSSRWWQWVLNLRPILYYLDYIDMTTKSAFGAFGGPVLYWGGAVAMLCVFWQWVKKRDVRAFIIAVGYLSSLLPWVFIDRLTFAYHYFPCTAFLALAIAYVFSIIVQKTERYKPYLYSACIASAVFFIMFYPVLTGLPFSTWYTNTFLRWIPDAWPF